MSGWNQAQGYSRLFICLENKQVVRWIKYSWLPLQGKGLYGWVFSK
jgi:hypothetical protein